jgi:hypothetical protein
VSSGVSPALPVSIDLSAPASAVVFVDAAGVRVTSMGERGGKCAKRSAMLVMMPVSC